MRIAVAGWGFSSWQGGLDFVRLVLLALLRDGAREGAELSLLLTRPTLADRARNRLAPLKRGALQLARGLRPDFSRAPFFGEDDMRRHFDSIGDGISIRFIGADDRALRDALRWIGPDVVLPSIRTLGREFPRPWIGYIYDFQHRYLPEFFTPAAREARDTQFRRILEDATTVVVNARAVRDDARRFFPGGRAAIFTLPFAPIPDERWHALRPDSPRARYGIPERYFLVSNQFWAHKDHETAWRALARLAARGGMGDVVMVCTGQTHDQRFPLHFPELMERARRLGVARRLAILGHIPKADQIALMKGCAAVVQPTLFEGGPGGGAVYDAVALGVPSIVSDIPVNREIDDPGVAFFRTGDDEDLEEKMRRALDAPRAEPDPARLREAAAARLALLSQALYLAVDHARGASSERASASTSTPVARQRVEQSRSNPKEEA